MAEYKLTVGLEIHAELKTRTKMFCQSANDPDESRPNFNVCPVCFGHPGTLPVINKEAVRQVLLVGIAVGGELADYTEFDRKNYFYPDIPKGYQISQYEHPLVRSGSLGGVQLTRIHLEEDTARSQHVKDGSLIDFNRAGVPLLELVTEPVIESAAQAKKFAEELQLLLRTLGVSDADMEKGHLRVEANVSINMGTKVEVKNLNSFRFVEKAIEYEFERQVELLEKGEKVVQETRGWDEKKGVTVSQRKKESSHDYRYFPDPDLPKLIISEVPDFAPEALRQALPELPWQKRERYQKLGLKNEDVETFVHQPELASYFDGVVTQLSKPEQIKTAANLVANIRPLPATDFLVEVLNSGLPSAQIKASILSGKIVAAASDDSLAEMVEEIIAANPAVVADYKNGKEAALQYLVGQGMKVSRGAANPAMLAKLLKDSIHTK